MSEIPSSWEWSTIGHVTQYIQRGKSPKYAEQSSLPVINQKCIRWDELQLQHLKYIHPDQFDAWDEPRYIKPGDILWNSTGTGTVGRAYLVKREDTVLPKVVDSHVTIVRPASDLEPRYLFNWIKSPAVQNKIEEMCDGTTNQIELSRTAIAATEIPIAPRAEQTRIADQLDTLLARIKACNDHLDAIPGLLKRFRQAVLNAATTGSLTEDWRAPEAKPWQPVLLGDVASDFSYGSAAKSSKAGAVPVLRMGNIQQGELDWTDLVYTSDPKEIEQYQLVPGDVLFNRTNSPELVGKTAVYQGERPAVYAGYLIRVRCSSALLPDFLNYCLGSKAGRDYCWAVKSDGVSQSNINAKKLAAFPLALPLPDEQEEIIRRVKSLFALSNGVEKRYRQMLARAERLTPQVLAKAFRGELVPQNPNDEPASVLLASLKTGPTSAAATPARKRSKATGERLKMSNVDQNSIKTVILKLETDRFSFDELRAHAAGDYESLKTALFALLEEPNPVVRQVFDEDAKAMRLVRVKP